MQIGQSTALDADRDIRTRHYTNAELQEQLALLNAEEQEIFSAYADGINRYVNDVVAADPASKLPFEFHSLGIGVPVPGRSSMSSRTPFTNRGSARPAARNGRTRLS